MEIQLNKDILIKELYAMEEVATEDNLNELKELLLVMANDPHLIKKCSLSDYARLFNNASKLLECCSGSVSDLFDSSCLKQVKTERRAL